MVAAAVLLSCVLFLPDASDPVNVVKLTALMLCAAVALALTASRVVRDRVAQVPVGPAAVSGLVLAAALGVATLVAPHTPTAVYGTLGRNSGLLAYGSAVLLFFVVLRTFDRSAARLLLLTLVLAGLFTATYGLLQYRGIDAVGWNNPFNPIIAGLGNPNFAAAYLGITVPAAVWGALWTGWHPAWRALSGAAALLSLVVAVLSDAVQGPLAALAGLSVLLVAWLLDRPDRVRRPALPALAVVAVLGLVTLGLGVAGRGPASAFFSGISYRARTWYWEGALAMFQRSPLWGVGLDSYGIRWRQERPIEVPRQLGGDHFSDAAHDVPLQMLAQGGLLLGLAYLALVVVVGVCLVRGLRRLQGQERLLLGGTRRLLGGLPGAVARLDRPGAAAGRAPRAGRGGRRRQRLGEASRGAPAGSTWPGPRPRCPATCGHRRGAPSTARRRRLRAALGDRAGRAGALLPRPVAHPGRHRGVRRRRRACRRRPRRWPTTTTPSSSRRGSPPTGSSGVSSTTTPAASRRPSRPSATRPPRTPSTSERCGPPVGSRSSPVTSTRPGATTSEGSSSIPPTAPPCWTSRSSGSSTTPPPRP